MVVNAKATTTAPRRAKPAHTAELACWTGIDDLAGRESVFDITGAWPSVGH